jgi:hypothetical protein
MTLPDVWIEKHSTQIIQDRARSDQLKFTGTPGGEDLGRMTTGLNGGTHVLTNIENDSHRRFPIEEREDVPQVRTIDELAFETPAEAIAVESKICRQRAVHI